MDLSAVRWSSTEYTLHEYVSKFHDSLPNIIKVTEGFLGKQEIDSVSSGTVLRVHSVYNQKRVTAESKVGKLFSLPFNLQSLKFIVAADPAKGLKIQDPLTLEEILAKYTLPITVNLSKILSFKEKGELNSQNEQLFDLTLIDTYEESFLVGHIIDKGKLIIEDPIIVPMYMTQLKLVAAKGLKQGNNEKWKVICEKFTYEVKTKGKTNQATFEEIFLLDKKDLSSQVTEYSTIEPIYIDISVLQQNTIEYLPNTGTLTVEPTEEAETQQATTFTKICDIPVDLRPLTVNQVCECLQLLNMKQYTATFKRAQVDGQLLYELDHDMMKNSLGMTALSSVKLSRFRDGWRPNLQS
ncbi:uncharacterized protein LOC128490657 [Spea bombifrons]|uniref:uncharacterized protein LOC128490657 n=1 Tax=Spea bombifrons TaxID=233779 RepID=UPI0023497103|nr:uncharacterized protein LOC128490657 [Spea bombifrons]